MKLSNVKSVTLKVVEESVRRYVDTHTINPDNIHFEVESELIAKDMVFTLTRKRPSESLGVVKFQVPETWFQAFKESLFPRFLLDKFPARYREIVVAGIAFYDRVTVPDHTTEIKLNVLDGEDFLK